MIFSRLTAWRSFHWSNRQRTLMSASEHSPAGTVTMYRQPPSPLRVKTRSSSRGDDSSITAAMFGTRSGLGICLLALTLASCSETAGPAVPPNISGSFALFAYGPNTLPARWLPDHRLPSTSSVSLEESTIESGSITFTPTSTPNVYAFTRVEVIPNFRVSPILRERRVFTTTGTATITADERIEYVAATGPDAGTTQPGGGVEHGVWYRAYDYRR